MSSGFSIVDFAQIAGAVGTVLAAGIAAYAAYQSNQTAKKIEYDAKRRRRPRIGMYLIPSQKSNSVVNIIINNYGGSVALDVKFKIKNDVEIQKGDNQKISEYLVFKNGLKAIYPDQTNEQRLMYLFGRDESFFTKPIEVEVTYRSDTMSSKDFYKETIFLDFLNLPEVSSPQKDIGDIVKELSQIRSELQQIRKKR